MVGVEEDKCIGCGNCKEICPKGGIIWTINKVAHVSNLDYCHVCTLCAMKCPTDAIYFIRHQHDIDMLEAKRKKNEG